MSAFELSGEETDVTSAIPAGYVPKVGDRIIYSIDNGQFILNGIKATYGFGNNSYDEMESILLTKENNTWNAKLFQI